MEVYISLIENFGREKLLKELAHAGLAKKGFLRIFVVVLGTIFL